QASGADNYNWSPAAGLSCVNVAKPVKTTYSAKKYIVNGTTLHGCSASDSLQITVQYPFKIKYSQADTLCKGQTLRMYASGAESFEWFPATGLDNSHIAA